LVRALPAIALVGLALSSGGAARGQTAAAGALSTQQVACDEARAEAILDRLTIQGGKGGSAAGFNLALTPGGGFAGVAYGGAAAGPERLLAVSAELAAELPADPAQPLLPALRLVRRSAASDAVPSRDPGRLRLVFDPTRLAAPGAAALLAVDDTISGAGVATGSGRGIGDFAAPCHPPLGARDAYVLELLTRIARAAAAGAHEVEIAVLRDAAPDVYRLNAYPLGGDGRPLGRLAVRLAVTYDATGALAGGTLALAPVPPSCVAASDGPGCTEVPVRTTLALVRPARAGAPPSRARYAVDGGAEGAGSPARAVDWADLLAGTPWRRPPAASDPPLRTSLGPAPAVPITAGDAACDRARLAELAGRLRTSGTAGRGGEPVGVNLSLAAGGFAGLAFTGGSAEPERRLAFTADLDELALPRNPSRPPLPSLDLTRGGLASPGAPRLAVAPGAPLAAACHPGFAARDAHVLALLVRLLRVEVPGAGAVATAVFRAGDGYAVEAFPAGAAGAAGPIGAYLDEISWDDAGRLAGGRLRFAPRCPAAAGTLCTGFAGRASIGFLRPAAPGARRGEIAFALHASPGAGALDAEVAVDFGALLAGSAWRSPAPIQPRALAEQLALGPVLWIGAHPDDELLAAPLLGEVCRERGARCTFLVATRGERGACGLPGGCLPDVATVRSAEMRAAVALFGAELAQSVFADGSAGDPRAVLANWAASLGGEGDAAALRATLAAFVARVRPQAIVTFDPRHGSTCHPDHRAVGLLVSETLAGLGAAAPPLYYLETRAGIEADGGVDFGIAEPADPALRSAGATATWPYLEADAAAHASQFSPQRRAALAAVPAAARRIALLPADDAIFLAGAYDAQCR
jgi:LmbE family N-acetylglucosaminyl deacetylase